MYDIDFAKKLDKDTAGVEIEGEVTFAKDPMNLKSKPGDKKQYDFWSQWIFLRDDTDSMGVSLAFGEEKDRVNQGDQIRIRGRIDVWTDRDGVPQKKLMAKVIKPKEEVTEEKRPKEETKVEVKAEAKEKVQETKVTNVVNKVTEGTIKDQEQIEKRDIRAKAIEISSNLVIAGKFACEKLFSFAERIVKYIYGNFKTTEELEEKTGVEKIGKKTKLEARITPDEVLKTLNKEASFQTWKEVLQYATIADICPVESTEKDIQRILTDNNKLIQKVIDTKKYRVKEEEKERLEREKAKVEKEGKDKEKEAEVDEYLSSLLEKAKEVGLKTWKEVIYFAVQSNVFQPGVDISEAKDRLFQHAELYNALLEAIEVKKDVKENVQGKEYTDEIPF